MSDISKPQPQKLCMARFAARARWGRSHGCSEKAGQPSNADVGICIEPGHPLFYEFRTLALSAAMRSEFPTVSRMVAKEARQRRLLSEEALAGIAAASWKIICDVMRGCIFSFCSVVH